ncbi:unnamed protein product [Rhodiola kirilowii]
MILMSYRSEKSPTVAMEKLSFERRCQRVLDGVVEDTKMIVIWNVGTNGGEG